MSNISNFAARTSCNNLSKRADLHSYCQKFCLPVRVEPQREFPIGKLAAIWNWPNGNIHHNNSFSEKYREKHWLLLLNFNLIITFFGIYCSFEIKFGESTRSRCYISVCMKLDKTRPGLGTENPVSERENDQCDFESEAASYSCQSYRK